MNNKRYISVEKSIINACREVKEMRIGKLEEPTLEDFFAEMNNLVEQEKFNENYTDKAIQSRY